MAIPKNNLPLKCLLLHTHTHTNVLYSHYGLVVFLFFTETYKYSNKRNFKHFRENRNSKWKILVFIAFMSSLSEQLSHKSRSRPYYVPIQLCPYYVPNSNFLCVCMSFPSD